MFNLSTMPASLVSWAEIVLCYVAASLFSNSQPLSVIKRRLSRLGPFSSKLVILFTK